MVTLNDSTSVDDFLGSVIEELGLEGELESTDNPRLVFGEGVYHFLDYAFTEGTEEEKAAIKLDPNREHNEETTGRYGRRIIAPNEKNVKTQVYRVVTGKVGLTDYDPFLLLVYQMVKLHNQPLVQQMKKEIFGEKGIDLRKAGPKDLEEIGMVPDGCHGFPIEPLNREVHMWIDQAPLLRRHSLYLNGTSNGVGYLDIGNDVFISLSEKISPRFKGVKDLTPSFYTSTFR